MIFLLCNESLDLECSDCLSDSPVDEPHAHQGETDDVSDNDNHCYWEGCVQQEETESSESIGEWVCIFVC